MRRPFLLVKTGSMTEEKSTVKNFIASFFSRRKWSMCTFILEPWLCQLLCKDFFICETADYFSVWGNTVKGHTGDIEYVWSGSTPKSRKCGKTCKVAKWKCQEKVFL